MSSTMVRWFSPSPPRTTVASGTGARPSWARLLAVSAFQPLSQGWAPAATLVRMRSKSASVCSRPGCVNFRACAVDVEVGSEAAGADVAGATVSEVAAAVVRRGHRRRRRRGAGRAGVQPAKASTTVSAARGPQRQEARRARAEKAAIQ